MRRTIFRPSPLGLRRVHPVRLGVLILVLAASTGLAAGAPPRAHADAAPAYTVTDLGVLPGYSHSYASGINASGQVVGDSGPSGGNTHAFRTTATGGIDAASNLGTLPGGSYSDATGINASGQVVGYAETGTGAEHAFRTTATGGIDAASDLGAFPGDDQSSATGINASGQVVGYRGNPAYPGHAFRTTATGRINAASDLGALPGSYVGTATGINGSGQVVGTSGPYPHAFRTTATGGIDAAFDLGTLPGSYVYSEAFGINASGQVVGSSYSEANGGTKHAFRTTATGGIDADNLGALPGDVNSVAFGINASGQVVGDSYTGNGLDLHAFLYDDSATPHMRDLNSLIPSDSGVTLTDTRGINDLGQIAATGTINGQTHAFRLTPSGTPTPMSPAAPCVIPASSSSMPSDEVFCGQPSTADAHTVAVNVTRYYGNVCRGATGPYEIDPADCQDTAAGHLTPGVIGTGVASTTFIDVVSNSGLTPLGNVVVNGHQASGLWIPAGMGSEYIGTIPTADLMFPNLDLASTAIQPPYPAPNVIAAPVPIGSASLGIQGTRPVILVHGIGAPQLPFQLNRVLQGQLPYDLFPASTLNAWSTWLNWLAPATNPQSPHIDKGFGYLRRIGVPNIRPNEENDLANKGDVICGRSWTGSTADRTCDAPCDASSNLREPSVPGLVTCAFPSDARAYTWPYADYRANKWFLLNMVGMVQKRYGVQQVNIVAHSKGTQDTEAAVAKDPYAFANVILQAPMYIGTNLADHVAVTLHQLEDTSRCVGYTFVICREFAIAANLLESQGQPTLTQLTTSYWKQQGHGLLDTVTPLPPIDAVAGTDGCNLANEVANFGFGTRCPGNIGRIRNDGAVPVYSVKAVPHATFYEFPVDHTDMNQWDEVFAHTCNLLQAPTIGPPCAQQVHNTSSSSVRSSAAYSAMDDVPAPVAFGPVSVLALAARQSGQISVAVPPSSSATLSLFSGQPISTTLIDPKGHPIDTAAAMAYTSTTQPDGTTLTSYTLSDPLPGAWTVVMTNTSATSSTVGTFTSSFNTSLALTGAAPPVIAPGATLPLTASVLTGTAPLDGAVITASVLISGAAPLYTTLLGVGNGAYSGSVTIPVTATGIASVVFEASGTTDGNPYDLTTDASSQVSGGQATIDAKITEQAVVNEGDGLYSALLITPTVTVPQTGTYELSGELVDRDGHPVASAASALTLTAGTATPASLSFDGRTIYNSGHDGPYTLQNLSLYNVASDAPLITPQTPYTTAAYQASQFEHPALIVAPTASSAAADPNADGLFQDLAVTATLQASLPGTYTVSAVLVDPAQAVITVTAETALLGTTPQAVRLDFPGQAIADHGVDGPYQVIGFTVRRADGSIVALVDALTTTGPYHAAQFASSPQGNVTETPTPPPSPPPPATSTPELDSGELLSLGLFSIGITLLARRKRRRSRR